MELQEVPVEFQSCVSAYGTRVSLSSRQLAPAQEWLANLTSLKILYLNSNKLKSLPEWVGGLTTLTALYLNGNELTALPESLGRSRRSSSPIRPSTGT